MYIMYICDIKGSRSNSMCILYYCIHKITNICVYTIYDCKLVYECMNILSIYSMRRSRLRCESL